MTETDHELDCREFLEIANDLMEQHKETWSQAVTEHLSSCPPCLIYLEQIQDLHHLLATLPRKELIPNQEQIRSIIAVAQKP